MDSEAESRFDQHVASSLLLEIAQEQTLENLLAKLVRRVTERPFVIRVRIWLIEKGDICSHCLRRDECPDQTRCLHAVASGRKVGTNVEVELSESSDRYSRVPLGVGAVGKIGATGQATLLNDVDREPGELATIYWLKEEKVRGFYGIPIKHKGEVLGVISVFNQRNVPEEAQVWGRLFADHVAGAVANVRAFEEIQRLKAQLEQQNAYLQEEVVEAKAFGDLVGQSAALRQIVSQIDLVAPTDASVLILGETGTGKELVAHEIHQRSRRKDKPLIRVNCASIPKELFESEFFGHARGSFTGAIKDRVGRFETADGGTLFLDEIGEVPIDLQGKLLRVLQERSYERVGEDRTRRADVRVIGATNRDLKKEVAAGRFREDLYYRLNVFPVQVAALRERKEDIPFLANHFIELSVRELRCPKPRLTKAGVAKLQSYDWPGNIRELRNVIERAVILARGDVLEFDLPVNEPAVMEGGKATRSSENQSEFLTETEMQTLERDNLLKVLRQADWKIKGADGAAELLGVRPSTLLSRIKKLGLRRPA